MMKSRDAAWPLLVLAALCGGVFAAWTGAGSVAVWLLGGAFCG